ncbi:MAG TPA: hypothetical protein VLX91_00750 [Candidatus Acidoferrales bacterium]|nr:hypothetical protein [Candidatus Acidoferrales bacterium]
MSVTAKSRPVYLYAGMAQSAYGIPRHLNGHNVRTGDAVKRHFVVLLLAMSGQ